MLYKYQINPVNLFTADDLLVSAGSDFYAGAREVKAMTVSHQPPYKMAILEPTPKDTNFYILYLYTGLDILLGNKHHKTTKILNYIMIDKNKFRSYGGKLELANLGLSFLHQGKKDYLVLKAKKVNLDDDIRKDKRELRILDTTFQFNEIFKGFKMPTSGYDAFTTVIADGQMRMCSERDEADCYTLSYIKGALKLCKMEAGGCDREPDRNMQTIIGQVEKYLSAAQTCIVYRNYLKPNYLDNKTLFSKVKGYCEDKEIHLSEDYAFGYKEVVNIRQEPSEHFAIAGDLMAFAKNRPIKLMSGGGVLSLQRFNIFKLEDIETFQALVATENKDNGFNAAAPSLLGVPASKGLADAPAQIIAHPTKKQFFLGQRNGNVYNIRFNPASTYFSPFLHQAEKEIESLDPSIKGSSSFHKTFLSPHTFQLPIYNNTSADIFVGELNNTGDHSWKLFDRLSLSLNIDYKKALSEVKELPTAMPGSILDADPNWHKFFISQYSKILQARMTANLAGEAYMGEKKLILKGQIESYDPPIAYHLANKVDTKWDDFIPGPLKVDTRSLVSIYPLIYQGENEGDATGTLYLYYEYRTGKYYYLADQSKPTAKSHSELTGLSDHIRYLPLQP